MTAATSLDQSLLYPSPLKEFWQAFSHNKGAVAGLAFNLMGFSIPAWMDPSVSRIGTASLALIAVNPALGWSTLLAQVLMRTPLKNKVTQHMRVTGTWADPQVTKISPPARKAP